MGAGASSARASTPCVRSPAATHRDRRNRFDRRIDERVAGRSMAAGAGLAVRVVGARSTLDCDTLMCEAKNRGPFARQHRLDSVERTASPVVRSVDSPGRASTRIAFASRLIVGVALGVGVAFDGVGRGERRSEALRPER